MLHVKNYCVMVLGTWSLFTLVYDIINRNLEESKYGVELQYIHIVWTNIDIDMTDTLPWVYEVQKTQIQFQILPNKIEFRKQACAFYYSILHHHFTISFRKRGSLSH